MSKVKTSKIKGGVDYAKVADRLLEFRSTNPRSKIAVKSDMDADGNLTHHAYIWKEKSDFVELLKSGVNAVDALESADAEGSSMMDAKRQAQEKGFEKNETIAIGRALAALGYAVSGEIASSEEMEEFEGWKAEKAEDAKIEAIKKLNKARNLDDLRKIWLALTNEQKLDKEIQAKKDAKKGELSEGSKDSAE